MYSYLPAPDEALWVAVLRLSISIPGARGLKDRRRVVLSMRDRFHARHHCAFAEVGHLDVAGQAVLAISVVGNEPSLLRARLDTIRADVEAHADCLIDSLRIEIVSFGALAARPAKN